MTKRKWDVSIAEARALQERLARAVIDSDQLGPVRRVAGVDVAVAGDRVRGAAAVLDLPGLDLVESAVAVRDLAFPYVPGYLSFRELPVALDALGRLETRPDLLLCDGQGLAHPRRFGLACHLGVVSGIPTIGVAKSRLVGRHEPVPEERGAWVPLWVDDPEGGGAVTVGAVVRTRARVAPVYVSIGHRVGLETAIRYVLECAPRYRLPETTRCADRLAAFTSPGPATPRPRAGAAARSGKRRSARP